MRSVFGPKIAEAGAVERKFGVKLEPFAKWEMGRYAKFRNFKYLAYPFSSNAWWRGGGRGGPVRFPLFTTRHFGGGGRQIETTSGLPVLMNFPDLLTGFMETWPAYVAPGPLVQALMRYEISLPVRHAADGVCAISDEFAARLAARGYPREKICPIYYGYDAQAFPLRPQPPPPAPPVVVMHGSFDAHHLGTVAFDAANGGCRQRPGTIFRFVGRRTPGWRNFSGGRKPFRGSNLKPRASPLMRRCPGSSPAPRWGLCPMKNRQERIVPLWPRSSNTSPPVCPRFARR